jgi:hypothetical protein
MATRKEAMMGAVKNGIDQANAQELIDVRLLVCAKLYLTSFSDVYLP